MLRFEAAEAYDMRHRLGGELLSQKLCATLEKGREVLTATPRPSGNDCGRPRGGGRSIN